MLPRPTKITALILLLAACAAERRPLAPAPTPSPLASSPKPSATPPAPIAPAPGSRAATGAIGTRGPTIVEAVGRDAGWVVFCQARQDSDQNGVVQVSVAANGTLGGDRLVRYLAIGSGEGEAIDELAAADLSGRWLVIRRQGSLSLLDTVSRKEVDLLALGADADNDRFSFREHRALSFDGVGASLLYLAKKEGSVRGIVRSLSTQREHAIDPGLSNVWRAELDHSGQWATFLGFANDTGPKSWPAPKADGPPTCKSPIERFRAWPARGDPPTRALAAIGDATATATPSFVIALGKNWVLREPDGRLILRRDGRDIELASAKCGAKILHADAERTRLVVACTSPKGRPRVEIVGVAERVELGVDVAFASDDRRPGEAQRLVPLYPGTATALVDLERAKLVALRDGDIVVLTHGARALVRRGRKLVVLDVDGPSERDLAAETDELPNEATNGALAAVSPWVVSLAGAKLLLGRIASRPLALAPDGQVLLSTATSDGIADGPLEWKRPAHEP